MKKILILALLSFVSTFELSADDFWGINHSSCTFSGTRLRIQTHGVYNYDLAGYGTVSGNTSNIIWAGGLAVDEQLWNMLIDGSVVFSFVTHHSERPYTLYLPVVGDGCVSTNVNDQSDGVPRLVRSKRGDCGMPVWEVSEPYISLWLHDEPLGYQPALGPRISFNLDFKQREVVTGWNPNFFSVGKKWNCSWLSYVAKDTNANYVVYFPGGGSRTYTTTNDYLSNSRLTGDTTNGFTLSFPDGSQDLYKFVVSSNTGAFQEAFLSERWSAQAQKTLLVYSTYNPTNPVVRLQYVVDGDGRTNTLYYVASNGFSTNLITQVVDPFGRTNSLTYDDNGYLTNITDVAGIPSSFLYDSFNCVTNLKTPYGPTAFAITDPSLGFSANGRSVLVTQPDGSKHLYLYQDNAAGVASSYSASEIPTTASYGNTFDTNELNLRNTFHWGPLQYVNLNPANLSALTTNQIRGARMQHWLKSGSNSVSETLSLVRDPSPDTTGATEGQKTWYDYAGKGSSASEGTQVGPLFVAQVLPDGTTRFSRTERNSLGSVTSETSTYSVGTNLLTRTGTFVYDSNGIDLLLATNALGVLVSSNSYNTYHEVVISHNALKEPMSFLYDASQRLTNIIAPNGLRTILNYGSDGFLERQIVVGFATNSFTWANDLIYTHTSPLGLVTTNTYDNLQRLRQTSDSRGTVTFTYNNLDLVRVLDRMGFTNSFGYDSMRRKIAETNTAGAITRYGYCQCGSLSSITNGFGASEQAVTQFTYDNQGNLTFTLYPDDYGTTVTYNSLRQLINSSDTGGASVTNSFNNQGLLIASSNLIGRIRGLIYDTLDRVTNSVDANGVSTITTYDDLNRVRTRMYPNTGVEQFGYTLNIAGLTSYTNQLTNVVNHVYDDWGRKTREEYPEIHSTNSFTYNGASDVVTLTDGKGQTTTWKYDSFGRLTDKLDNLSTNLFSYGYDSNDRMTTRTNAAKGRTVYQYDNTGNLTTVTYPHATNTFAYDQFNRLTNMVAAETLTSRYTYNTIGQLLSEDGPWASDTVGYTYQNRLRSELSLSAPNASAWTQSFGYDAAKRLRSITSPAGVFDYNYLASSPLLLAKLSLPGGAYITNSYDNVSRLLSTVLKNSTNGLLNSHIYGYDIANRRTALTNTFGDYRRYTYDSAGQLKTALGKEANGTDRKHEQFGYAYDAAGNLNLRTNYALVQTFNVNSLNELTTVTRNTTNALTVAGNTTSGATNVTVNGLAATLYDDFTFVSTNFTITNGINTFTATANDINGRTDTTTTSVNLSATNSYIYDLDGNLLSDGIRAFDYDDENQLIRVTVTNAWKSEFTYDGKFRRRIRKEFTWTGSTWSQTNEVRYIYDGNAVLQERDANNLPTVSYTRTGMRLLARTENASLLLGSPSAHAYYHADGNGNVTALISTNQLIVARYLYDPFGNILSESGPLSAVNLCRYSSQEFHANSGLIYFGRRFYDSSLQRFINRDPIEETGGNNLYTFVVNNPIALVDIMGLCAQNPSLWDLFWSNIYENWQQNTVGYFRAIGHGAQGLANMAWNAVTDPVGFTYNAVAGIAQQLGNAIVDPSGYAKNVWDGFVNNLTTSEGIGKFVFGLELGLATAGIGTEAGAVGETGANIAAKTTVAAGNEAFYFGEGALEAAVADGANLIRLTPEAEAALAAGNETHTIYQSASFATKASGDVTVYVGAGSKAGYTFWNYELPQLLKNVNNGRISSITYKFVKP